MALEAMADLYWTLPPDAAADWVKDSREGPCSPRPWTNYYASWTSIWNCWLKSGRKRRH